jgi:hypothetical protein
MLEEREATSVHIGIGPTIAVVFAFAQPGVWAQQPQAGCSCPTELLVPAVTHPLIAVGGRRAGDAGLAVCGSIEKRKSDVDVIAAEFGVFACPSKERVLEFDALQRAEVLASDGRLRITELTNWPFGADWKWIDVPLREFTVVPGTPPTVFRRTVLARPKLTSTQIKLVLNEFRSFRRSRVDKEENLANLVGRLLAVALTGDGASISAFREMRTILNSLDPFDAESAELYNAASDVYKEYVQAHGATPTH